MNAKSAFFALDAQAFDRYATNWNWPKFRADQVRDWVYRKNVLDFNQMSNLSKNDRALLEHEISFLNSTVTRRQDSEDGTIKLLLTWPDGSTAETVMIPDADRRTACVSSQVGCPAGCKFCASGIDGVKGNLTADQIIEQIMQLNQILGPVGERVNHVVFMGMGEPMANYANVMQAIRVMHDMMCLNISARKITISTVGVPSRIRQLAEEELPLNLALSLHAPNEELRKELIPWAEHFELEDILEATKAYFKHTGREITLEYILLADVNDRPDHARQLARLCKSMRANVNLIRYNPVTDLPYRRPVAKDVMEFQEILRSAGVNAHVRKSRGRDIDAACGQLRRKENAAGNDPLTQVTIRKGFSIIELLVAIGLLVILASILVPYVLKIREGNRRAQCQNNLKQLGSALQGYAKTNGWNYPRVVLDEKNPNSWTCFTGADDANPFATESKVRPNDVTASLWLLVRYDLVTPNLFICPSTSDRQDVLTPTAPARQRGNFRKANNLSYSYCSPFSAVPDYRINDTLPAEFAIMADKSPGVVSPPIESAPLEIARGNSRNHSRAGQNVLYADGHVDFRESPYYGREKDNIFTALRDSPLQPGEKPPAWMPGAVGRNVGPTWWADSYLVPGENDKEP